MIGQDGVRSAGRHSERRGWTLSSEPRPVGAPGDRQVGIAIDLTVERISDPVRLPPLAALWDDLIDERSPGAVFRSGAWLLPWWSCFAPGKELSIYTAYAGSHLIGVLPAYRVDTPLGGRQLRLIGDGSVGSDYLGVIARPADLEVASAAIARAVVAQERDVAIDGLADDDPLVSALEVAARTTGAGFSQTAYLPCPFISISGAGDFAAWLARLPKGTGAQLRRRRRWLERQPGFRIDVLTGERELCEALATLWRLHRARWLRQGGGVITCAAVKQFHDESARALARRGWARLYLLQVEGEPRAALYGFGRGGRFAFYQSGSDPAWRQRSVGRVVLGAAIEDAFGRGLEEFDFLRGDEAYKSLFASSHRQLLRTRVVAGRRARTLWLLDRARAAGRGLAHRVLPPVAVDWVRRCRQRRPDVTA
jgi:CelD/BcsL family acetyltransferase involved in cellulose biosynthesis